MSVNGGALEGLSCLDAIARGSGEEVFSLNSKSQLVAVTGECVSLVGGSSQKLVMQDCEGAAEAGDGRSNFVLSPSSQVKTKDGYCIAASAAGASAAPCSAEEESTVTAVAVPEFDAGPAGLVQDAAALLRAAVARQRTLLKELSARLGACKGFIQGNSSRAQTAAWATMSKSLASVSLDPALEATSKIDGAVDVDLAAVKALISESKAILASAS